jgi:hypothetical protein
MPWKKTWPSAVKDELRQLHISESKIAMLEKFGSFEKFQSDPINAFKAAEAAQVQSILKKSGIL